MTHYPKYHGVHNYVDFEYKVQILCMQVCLSCSLLASVSVGFRSKETPRNGILPARNWGESKIRKRGWGRGRKETLADKPLDFENLRSPANGAHDWLDQSNIIDMCRSYDQEWEACLQKFLVERGFSRELRRTVEIV